MNIKTIQAGISDKTTLADKNTELKKTKSRLSKPRPKQYFSPIESNIFRFFKARKMIPAVFTVLYCLFFYTTNSYAQTPMGIACPTGFASDVVCSCDGTDLLLTSGGSTSNFGFSSACLGSVDSSSSFNFDEIARLQQVAINAGVSVEFFERIFGYRSLALDPFAGNTFLLQEGSASNSYLSSDLPEWDFSATLQSNLAQSEISLTSAPDLESDVHSVNIDLRAAKDQFSLSSQLRFQAIEGRNNNNGLDTIQYSMLLAPAYQLLKQAEQGLNLGVYGFLGISANENQGFADQTRFSSGAGFELSRWTSLGLFKLGYTFTHDRNFSNDTEITGDQYFNIHQIRFKHSLKLLDSLLFSTKLSHLQLTDIPDAVDNSGSNAGFEFSYIGIKNTVLSFNYSKSFDGFGFEGGNISASYNW